MKSKDELLRNMLIFLAELESGTVKIEELDRTLQTQSSTLYHDVLDEEDIEEEYCERIEDAINME